MGSASSHLLAPLGLACPVVLHHASSTIQVTSSSDLVAHVRKHCPNLAGAEAYYYPTPYMIGGHAQTIYAAMNKFQKVDQIRYSRRILESPDGGTISMDFTSSDDPNEWIDTDSSRPLLIILHGLTGGSHESYVRALLAELVKKSHWRAVVVNFRGCAETPVTSQRLYSAGWTEDIRLATRWLRHQYPNAPFVGAGFSLGANILTKYLGEEGSQTEYRAAMVAGNPWNLELSNMVLESSYIGRHVYSPAMGSNLGRIFATHSNALKSNPLFEESLTTPEAIKEAKTIKNFDEKWTALSFGFPTASAYYRASSSTPYLSLIAIPFLGLNSLDDPIVTGHAIPYDEARFNPNVILATTAHGGHLGWFQGGFKVSRWNPKCMVEFAEAMLSIEKAPKKDAYDLAKKIAWTDETNYKKHRDLHNYPTNGSGKFPIEKIIVRRPQPHEQRASEHEAVAKDDPKYSF